MKDFNLKKYLAENKLLKEELTWFIDDENSDVRYENDAYLKEVGDKIKELHPDISDEDLNEIIFRTGEQYSREEDFHGDSIPSNHFADAAIEIYQTDILAEGRLLKEDYTQKKYTEEEWKRELDLNVEMAARLIDYQANGGSWQDLMTDLIAMQKRSIITGSDIKFFIEWIESQEDNKLPNLSSGSFFTGLTDVDGLLSAMNFENEDENGEELYTDEEYEAAQKYHTDKINQLDWSKY